MKRKRQTPSHQTQQGERVSIRRSYRYLASTRGGVLLSSCLLVGLFFIVLICLTIYVSVGNLNTTDKWESICCIYCIQNKIPKIPNIISACISSVYMFTIVPSHWVNQEVTVVEIGGEKRIDKSLFSSDTCTPNDL